MSVAHFPLFFSRRKYINDVLMKTRLHIKFIHFIEPINSQQECYLSVLCLNLQLILTERQTVESFNGYIVLWGVEWEVHFLLLLLGFFFF